MFLVYIFFIGSLKFFCFLYISIYIVEIVEDIEEVIILLMGDFAFVRFFFNDDIVYKEFLCVLI